MRPKPLVTIKTWYGRNITYRAVCECGYKSRAFAYPGMAESAGTAHANAVGHRTDYRWGTR